MNKLQEVLTMNIVSIKQIALILFMTCFIQVLLPCQEHINLIPDNITVRRFTLNDQDQLEHVYGVSESLFYEDPSSVFDKLKTSSTLPRDKYGSYDAKMAVDGSLETAWVEGKDGPGTGEYIFCVFQASDYLYIFPGYGSSEKIWKLNNRVKKARITAYGLGVYTTTGAPEPVFNPMVEEFTVMFKDRYAYQGIPMGKYQCSRGGNWEKFWFVRIEILDVYKGTKYDDTCIAEIKSSEEIVADDY
jgi:hypothetical protein